jgi:hypothetical protein
MAAAIAQKTVVDAKVYKGPDKNNPGVLMTKVDPVTALKGQTIRWAFYDAQSGEEIDHVFSIWFPIAGVFATPMIAVMHNGAVEATISTDVRKNAKDEKEVLKYEYCIYDHTEQEFVTCQSHPRIEIPGP